MRKKNHSLCLRDMNNDYTSNAAWNIKIIMVWLTGFFGDVLSVTHDILGNLVLLATLVFTIMQIIKMYRELRRKQIAIRDSQRLDLK